MAITSGSALERYQSKPFLGSSHSWAFTELAALPATATVLDIGSGSGVIGKYLKSRGLNELNAIEVDPAAIQNTASIYKRTERSIEAFGTEQFDAILMLDILEHLPNPAMMLHQAAALLRPGGVALISVPNIAHWSVRLGLLFGRFHYTDRGILDRTHLHFFTRRSFEQFLRAQPNLRVLKHDSTIEPAEFLLPEILVSNPLFRGLSQLRLGVARALPGFFAYQHLARVERLS
ncbi:MAG: class I SAM-dependent methyltransferase [Oligoflexia bacterium]|nr:class I SAM-dependent methyltransferase [Oligoflexia bacterium]